MLNKDYPPPLETYRTAYTCIFPCIGPYSVRSLYPITSVEHIGGVVLIFEHATYYEPEEGVFDPDETIIVRPIMKCAGRGLSLRERK